VIRQAIPPDGQMLTSSLYSMTARKLSFPGRSQVMEVYTARNLSQLATRPQVIPSSTHMIAHRSIKLAPQHAVHVCGRMCNSVRLAITYEHKTDSKQPRTSTKKTATALHKMIVADSPCPLLSLMKMPLLVAPGVTRTVVPATLAEI
jgi:hypothetical protein